MSRLLSTDSASGQPFEPPSADPHAVCCGMGDGHSTIESAVRYLGIAVDDAIEIAEKIDF